MTRDLPPAKVTERKKISFIWIVPVIAAVAAGWLVFAIAHKTGPVVTIQFDNGEGLRANQTILKYRGVRIGQVKSVELGKDGTHVMVEARLTAAGGRLACDGSVFWIVRPEVGVGGLSGLETIVSGPYIQVQPGEGKTQKNFIGAEEAPMVEDSEKGLEVVLKAPHVNTLSEGSGIYYRGIQVGSVEYIVLATNASEVEIHALIKPAFAPLVRNDTQFWNAGGISMRLKLFGIDVQAENFKSLVVGGIAFATPTEPGIMASNGEAFVLNEKMEDAWQKWSPAIAITNASPTADRRSAQTLLLNSVGAESAKQQ